MLNAVSVKKESRTLFILFVPLFLGLLSNCAMSAVDTLMSGMAGTIELSGVALGTTFTFPCYLFLQCTAAAITPTVSHLLALNKLRRIHISTFNATVTSVTIAVITSILLLSMKYVIDFIPSDKEMVSIASDYILFIALGLPSVSFFYSRLSFIQGLGISKLTLYFGILELCLNIPLNYIFIFGKLGVPAFGGAGCGLTTSLIYTICAVVIIFYERHSTLLDKYRTTKKTAILFLKDIKSFLKLGIPIGISRTVEVTGFTMAALILSPFGPVVMAAHTITLSISGLIFMIPLSLGISGTIRVAYAMGTKNWDHARLILKIILSINLLLYIIYFSLVFLFRENLAGLYISDPEVIALASGLLILNCIYMLPDSVQSVLSCVLMGFKDSKVIFYVTVSAYWLIGLPLGSALAWGLFTDKLHAYGIWTGFIFALSVAAVLFASRTFYLFKTRTYPKLLLESYHNKKE